MYIPSHKLLQISVKRPYATTEMAIKSQRVKLKEFSYIFAGQCVVNGRKHVHIYLQRYKKQIKEVVFYIM